MKHLSMEHIVILGGGGTGAALSHDLALRGFKISLFEKGELLSGTTGRHHGLLHSGARYAVQDPEAARACMAENRILARIAPESIEQNGGLFVALDDADLEYATSFLEACNACGITARKLNADQARAIEPALGPNLKLAVQVPDATMDAWRLPLQFYATAKTNGAVINPFAEAVAVHQHNGLVTGIRIFDHKTHREYDVSGDLVVNAAGAWAGKIAALAGIRVPIQPGPGVMVAVKSRLTNMVVSRLHPAAEGDIILPQRKLSILGTSLWLADDPDLICLPPDHIRKMVALCSRMVPSVTDAPLHSAWHGVRPLLGNAKNVHPQAISRSFECYDHRKQDNIEGLVSIIGGKATTLRAMAEKTADIICRKTGRDIPCRTKTEKLLHWRMFYK
jgi:glycerol-3-phosphate dehydrogenase